MIEYSWRQRLRGALRLAHPIVSLFGSLYVLLGAYLASDLDALWTREVLVAAVVTWFIVSFSFVINHYQDLSVDSLAKPDRPLPSGLVKPREARVMFIALAAMALSLSLYLSWSLRLLAVANIAIGAAYSLRLKDTMLVGNASVAYLNASTLLAGGLAVGHLSLLNWVGFGMVFLFMLAQEVLFAAMDYEGDRRANLRTTANRLGQRQALRLFKGLALAFVGVALLPALLGVAADYYLYVAIPCTLLPIVGAVALLTWKVTPRTIWLATRVVVFLWGSSALPLLLMK